MTFIEAFAGIFVGIWQFLTNPAMMTLYAVIIMAGSIAAFLGAITADKGDFRNGWVRTAWTLGFVLTFFVGLAIAIWAGTSSPDGVHWS